MIRVRRHWWSNRCACSIAEGYHSDASVGLAAGLSRRLQRQICQLTAEVSFAAAREHVYELLGVALSVETLRKVSHRHGGQMARWQSQDESGLARFRAAAGGVEFTVDAGKVNTREQGWKDLKIAVLQKRRPAAPASVTQWDRQRLPAATARLAWGEIAPARKFRQSWRGWTKRAGIRQPAEMHTLADGAGWIWKSVERVLSGCQQTLDIYHGCAHLAKAAERLYGETSEAVAFLQRGRESLLSKGWSGICQLVSEEYARQDTPARRQVLEKLVGYFAKHTNRLDYARRLEAGQAIGSGAVEGQAKTLGLRLKARGARWKRRHIKGMTALVCVRRSTQWDTYWSRSAA